MLRSARAAAQFIPQIRAPLASSLYLRSLCQLSSMPASVVCKFEKVTGTAQFIVSCPETKKCAIIDPVLDYNPVDGKATTDSADELLAYIKEEGLECQWILESHVHADHITASHYLKTQLPAARTAMGERVAEVQRTFQALYNLPDEAIAGPFFDQLFTDGEKFSIGQLEVEVLPSPGHTPADVSFYIKEDALFTGDSIFMPDMGTARCDFPGGSAETLWSSVQRLLALPPATRVFVGHDYGPGGRDLSAETTIGEQLEKNKHVNSKATKEQFIEARTSRDAELNVPRLLHASLSWNIRGGRPPMAESNGSSYVKVPVDVGDWAKK